MRAIIKYLKVLLPVSAMYFLPVSCETNRMIDENENENNGKNKTVNLLVNVPERSISSYASVDGTEDENHIDTLFVKLYESGNPNPVEIRKFYGSELQPVNGTNDSIVNVAFETDKLSGGGMITVEVYANRMKIAPITGEIPLPDRQDASTLFMMSGSGALTYNGTSYNGTIPVIRNVAKLRVRISKHPNILPANLIIHYDKTKVEVVNTPDRTQLLTPPPAAPPPGLAYISYAPRTGVGLRPESPIGVFAGGQTDSLYLNENYLEDVDYTDDGKKTQLKISITTQEPGFPEKTSEYTYPLFVENSYRVKRNHIYTLDIKIAGQSLEPLVTMDIRPWSEVAINGDINGVFLSLEKSELEILPVHTENSPARVAYHTDHASVSLDWSEVDPSYNIDMSVTGIQGSDGEVKIYWQAGGAPVQNFTDTVYVVVRNIRIALALKYNLTATPGPWVGAFYRWNQTGERIIKMPGEGDWTATVTHGSDFIVLDGMPSKDPHLCTGAAALGNDAGFDDDYPVNSDAASIAGKGIVFFRTGLKSRLAYMGAPPRYGVVEVVQGGVTRKIYVRQGEEADYIMRPTDENPSDSYSPRAYAMKLSPYNLSDPGRGVGGNDINAHNTMLYGETVFSSNKFTDYPSQGGYLFQWNLGAGSSHRAYHPANPVATAISNWDAAQKNAWEKTLEPCPAGYRHPNDSLKSPATSEIRQSLYLIPGEATGLTPSNSVRGYYADGFFDRLPINKSPNGADSTTVSFNLSNLIDAANTKVAYTGRLIYNPVTNASVFLPASGVRNGADGTLQMSGETGLYWTSTRWEDNDYLSCAFTFSPTESGENRIRDVYRNNGVSIRCVKDDFGLPGSPGY